MRTSNPVFSSYFWSHNKSAGRTKMSLWGIFYKSVISLSLLGLSMFYVWELVERGVNVRWYTMGGMLAAIVFSILTSYRKRWAPITAPLYAFSKGFFLGGFSALINRQFHGYPVKAVFITVVAFLSLLILYELRWIRVTRRFRSFIYASVFTLMMVYLLSWILSFFGIYSGLVWGTSWFSIVFNIIAAGVAASSLLLDFYYIERQMHRAPKYMEWVAVWGLSVSLIWLYVEVLRLMRKWTLRGIG